MDEVLKRDQNYITVLGGITNDSDQDITMLRVDPISKRLLVSATGISPTSPGGSDTQIQFNDSGAFGGANVYYIKATGNVGIGITTPTEKLDVAGAIALNSALALWADSPHVNVGVGNSNFRNTVLPNSITGNGIQNTYFGDQSLNSNILGFLNAGFGDNTLGLNTDGYANGAFGSGALASNTTGFNNVGFGPFSLISNTVGSDNIGVGFFAGGSIDTGSGNLILGSNAGASIITGSNNIILGANVDTPSTTDVSNTLNIGNSIYGTGLGGTLKIGIGIAVPTNTLSVNGTANFTSLTATRIPIASTAGLLTDTADLTFDTATPTMTFGGGIVTLVKTMNGSGGNFLKVIGTVNTTNTNAVRAILFNITSAGSSNQGQTAARIILNAGYTGANLTIAGNFVNNAAGTGATGFGGSLANFGLQGGAGGTTSGNNVGVDFFAAASSSLNLGVNARAVGSTNTPALNVGGSSMALNATVNVGFFAGLMNGTPTLGSSSALIADNGAVATDIFEARDNGTVVFTIADGGTVNVSTLTASRVVQTDASKNLQSSAVTTTELGYVSGVTSAIQTQLNSRTFYSGSFSGVGAATTTFTVTIGTTQANTTYRVNVTPTSILGAAVYYVNNKTTTTFDVVYLTGLTGTLTLDWSLFP